MKEALDVNKTYDSLALSFPSDYDKENPLTTKQGQIRILELQIREAEKIGDHTTAAKLRQQEDAVQNQGFFQQMQNYTN